MCIFQSINAFNVVPVSCPDLLEPTNGQVNLSTDGHISVAKFSCIDGYYLTGSDTLTCLEDGTWDNVSPTCCITFEILADN